MGKKNVRAKPGSGEKHDKHAPTECGVKHDKHAPTKTVRVAATDETETAISGPPKSSNKTEILEWCEANDINIDSDMKKSDMLDAIAELLDSE